MVYLLHFERPISPHHYIGYTEDIDARLEEHRNGHGARLCAVAAERGISFELVRTWDGDRTEECRLKNRKNGHRLCPICREEKTL